MIGTYVLSHGYYDPTMQAQKRRRMIADLTFQQLFTVCCDGAGGGVGRRSGATVAWKLGAKTMTLWPIPCRHLTLPASCGRAWHERAAGFAKAPAVGLQLIGNYFAEGTLLHAAHALQQATDWHRQVPTGF